LEAHVDFNRFSTLSHSLPGPRAAMEVLGQLKFLRVLFSFSAGPIRVFSKLPIRACQPDSGAPYIFGDWARPGYYDTSCPNEFSTSHPRRLGNQETEHNLNATKDDVMSFAGL
jgi:hypothetical protein